MALLDGLIISNILPLFAFNNFTLMGWAKNGKRLQLANWEEGIGVLRVHEVFLAISIPRVGPLTCEHPL